MTPATRPNRFRLCPGAAAFLAALRADLAGCGSTLFVQFTTFEGDASGEAVADLLIERAAAGVDVRLVLDHYSDVVADDILPFRITHRAQLRAERHRTLRLLARLEASGVVIHRTAPVGALRQYILFRDHKKVVVIDGRIAYLGGINVSDHNFGWHDFMVRVAGPLAVTLERDFHATWTGTPLVLEAPAAVGRGDYAVNQGPGRPRVLDEILRLIDDAEHSVFLETPSLLGRRVEDALATAAQRGVRITVVLPARHNRWIFRVWARRTLRNLRHPHIAVVGYRGTDLMTHAKLVIVDDRRVAFGSANLFTLEAATQKELNAFSDDPDLVGQLRAQAALDIAASRPIEAPRFTFGRWTYAVLEWGVDHWTRRLLRRPAFRTRYT